MKASYHSHVNQLRSLINKDGNMNVRGTRERFALFGDLYHYFFALSWPGFFMHILALYLTVNVIFGLLYCLLNVQLLEGHSAGLEHFKDCFFLSVETASAVDYARIQPSGWLTYGVMTIQAFLGILILAVMTGLFYARFSRPTARVIFSNKAIIASHNGRQFLFFRVANERLNQVAEARMGLTLTKNEISTEGEHSRKFYDLKLERAHTPLFSLSWMIRHPIDKDSPLFGLDAQAMREEQVGIVASLTGIDEAFSQPIMARHIYTPGDIVFDKRFRDIILWDEKTVHVNLKDIHEIEEIP